MPVYSMTGYATTQSQPAETDLPTPAASAVLGMEIRSVNSRFLDISLRLSDELRPAEPALRELIGARIKRGKVEVRAWIEGRGKILRENGPAADVVRRGGAQRHSPIPVAG